MQQNPLISNGRFLTPDNYLVKLNKVEDIPSILHDCGIDIEKPISYAIDRGYGDVIGRTNYWLWLNQLCPLSLNFVVVEDHYELFRHNVETTVERTELLMNEYDFSNFTFETVDDKKFHNLKDNKHQSNNGNYFCINLYNKLQDWYPFKKTWTGKFSNYVAFYDNDYADWERVLLTWSQNQDKVNGISDEKKYLKFKENIVSNLKKQYEVKKFDYTISTPQFIDTIRKANFTVSNRGAVPYITACMNAPQVLTIKQKYLETYRYYCNFTKNIVYCDDPIHIGKLSNQHKDFFTCEKHKYIKEGFLPKEI